MGYVDTNFDVKEAKKLAAASKRLEKMQLSQCFDASDLESRPTAAQTEIFKAINRYRFRIVRSGNQSGKSTLAAREIAWVLNGEHPYWVRPKNWNEPLLIIVAGQTRMLMETELWGKKLSRFLDASKWKPHKIASALQWVDNIETGDRILFIPHGDGADDTIRNLQGFVAHYVWLDEMPSSIKVVQELQERIMSKKGAFIATFSPKFQNESLRHLIESMPADIGAVFSLSKLDNPVYAGRQSEIMAALEGHTDAFKRAILYGDWFQGDTAVYQFTPESMVVDKLPPHYSPMWRHVESVDPALKSKFGYTLWAEDPLDGVWYLMKDNYITGIYDANKMLEHVRKCSAGHNIVRYVCDPHEPFYIGIAATAGIHYTSPYNKNQRKGELIKGLQRALTEGRIKIASWCKDTIQELYSCQWSEKAANKIVNADKYHNLDCSQYFVDCMPERDLTVIPKTWEERLREGDAQREADEAKQRKPDVSSIRPKVEWTTNSIKRVSQWRY